jgi:site-specific recombinase
MALLKILGASFDLALLSQGLMNGAIYGVGFAIIYRDHQRLGRFMSPEQAK